jgi:hypothetical protein
MKKLINYLLITSCMLVQAQNNINLPQGWSMFGYNCSIPLDAGIAFSPITDKIVIVKDHLGNAYLPAANFNGIGNLMESTGYQIKMTETVEGFEFCEAVLPEDGITQADVDAIQGLLDAVVPEDGITQVDVDAIQALLDAVVPEDGITQSDVDLVQALLDSVVPEDGIGQGDVDAAYLDGVDSVVPEDGITQSDVDLVQALLDSVVPEDGIGQGDVDAAYLDGVDSVVPEDGITQSDVDLVQALLDSVVPEDGIGQGDVDAAYLDGVDSVVPEDGITQSDVDAAVSAVQEDYIGWCLSDIDNDGICDVDEVVGCMETTACNYTLEAEFSDASCTYAEAYFDCDGNQIAFYYIGDLAHGGMVFYIDETGEHGLVAALEDVTDGSNMGGPGDPEALEGFEWGCFSQSVGTDTLGYYNTNHISEQNCQTYNGGITAAQATLNYEAEGYTDWFLPSKEELQEMFSTIGIGGLQDNIGGFVVDYFNYPDYWSSSQFSIYKAWGVDFSSGSTNADNKDNFYRVRAIRAF